MNRPRPKKKLINPKNQFRFLDELRKQGKLGKGKKPLVKANSAGGVVFTRIDGRIHFLLIQHAFNHHWSIPKGYVEPDEAIEAAAVREIKEETGVDAEIIDFLGHIDIHTTHPEHRMHRKLHAYLLESKSGSVLHPDLFDPEEGMIGAVKWFTPQTALKKIAYKNLRGIVRKADERLKELDRG
jgi:8-oxo-dGTP diphosphatase